MRCNQYSAAPVEERFASCVRRTASCWLWSGSVDGTGRGTIKVNGKQVGAHRLSWLLHRGQIPGGLHVLHRCDVPTCVNPDHLFLGTHADNMADMTNKGRQAKGEKQGRAKLLPHQVHAIRSDPRPQVVIAYEYNIGQTQVSRIKSNQRWTHI